MKLGGWQRLGIFLSAIWILSVGLFVVYEANSKPMGNKYFVEMLEPDPVGKGNSFESIFADLPQEKRIKTKKIMATLLAPVILSWFLCYLLVWSIKWIVKGFRQ